MELYKKTELLIAARKRLSGHLHSLTKVKNNSWNPHSKPDKITKHNSDKIVESKPFRVITIYDDFPEPVKKQELLSKETRVGKCWSAIKRYFRLKVNQMFLSEKIAGFLPE